MNANLKPLWPVEPKVVPVYKDEATLGRAMLANAKGKPFAGAGKFRGGGTDKAANGRVAKRRDRILERIGKGAASANTIARDLGVPLRTVYGDINVLKTRGTIWSYQEGTSVFYVHAYHPGYELNPKRMAVLKEGVKDGRP